MLLYDATYQDALAKAEHLIALGETTVHIKAEGAPWDKAETVMAGGVWRLNGPTGCYIVARDAGLTFKWSVDFESRGANGQSVSLFDRKRLREVAAMLPPVAREAFAEFLAVSVLPELAKRTNEIREYLNKQAESEDCVRGLIAYARAFAEPS
jgi:hypothetical protein